MDITKRLATLNRIRTLSRLMDNAIRIPWLGYRIGARSNYRFGTSIRRSN